MVRHQPPLGGCVLKPAFRLRVFEVGFPAAFRRLCVETGDSTTFSTPSPPAAFRRLCVETPNGTHVPPKPCAQPPLGGCVLKQERK